MCGYCYLDLVSLLRLLLALLRRGQQQIQGELYTVLKGIVSRDWGGLQMILLDRYIVVNISAGGSF